MKEENKVKEAVEIEKAFKQLEEEFALAIILASNEE